MSDYSKILITLPIIMELIILDVDYTTGFEITQSQVDQIEFIIGETVIGGVSNAGSK